jgi:hypothetical protein
MWLHPQTIFDDQHGIRTRFDQTFERHFGARVFLGEKLQSLSILRLQSFLQRLDKPFPSRNTVWVRDALLINHEAIDVF